MLFYRRPHNWNNVLASAGATQKQSNFSLDGYFVVAHRPFIHLHDCSCYLSKSQIKPNSIVIANVVWILYARHISNTHSHIWHVPLSRSIRIWFADVLWPKHTHGRLHFPTSKLSHQKFAIVFSGSLLCWWCVWGAESFYCELGNPLQITNIVNILCISRRSQLHTNPTQINILYHIRVRTPLVGCSVSLSNERP